MLAGINEPQPRDSGADCGGSGSKLGPPTLFGLGSDSDLSATWPSLQSLSWSVSDLKTALAWMCAYQPPRVAFPSSLYEQLFSFMWLLMEDAIIENPSSHQSESGSEMFEMSWMRISLALWQNQAHAFIKYLHISAYKTKRAHEKDITKDEINDERPYWLRKRCLVNKMA